MNEKCKNVHNLCINCGQEFLEIFIRKVSKNGFFIDSYFFICLREAFLCHKQYNTLSTETTLNDCEIYFILLSMSVTYQPKKKKRRSTHGFLARKATANGRKVIKRRMQKGRKRIAV